MVYIGSEEKSISATSATLGDLEEWKEVPWIKNPDARPILLERSRKLLYWAKET
jgi:hypothetical protein